MGTRSWSKLLSLLVTTMILFAGCSQTSRKAVRKAREKFPWSVRSYHAAVSDNDEETHDNVTVETAELETNIDHGAAFDWTFSPEASLEFSVLHGRHTLEDTSDVDIGNVSATPVFLTLKGNYETIVPLFNPYLGIGASYARFSGESLDPGSGLTDFEVEDSVGFVLQFGTEITPHPRNGRFFFALDAKVNLMSTSVVLEDASSSASERLEIIPFIGGVMIGFRF